MPAASGNSPRSQLTLLIPFTLIADSLIFSSVRLTGIPRERNLSASRTAVQHDSLTAEAGAFCCLKLLLLPLALASRIRCQSTGTFSLCMHHQAESNIHRSRRDRRQSQACASSSKRCSLDFRSCMALPSIRPVARMLRTTEVPGSMSQFPYPETIGHRSRPHPCMEETRKEFGFQHTAAAILGHPRRPE